MKRSTLVRFFAVLCLSLVLATPAFARERILLVGDSWGYLLAQYRSFDTVLASSGIPDVQSFGIAVGGTTAAQWATPAYLQAIDDALAAHPTIDLVHVSLGANDIVWSAFPLLQRSLPEREAILDAVTANIGILARHVVDHHPGVEVVLGDYDYVNLVDFRSRANRNRDQAWQSQTSANWVLGELGRRRQALADTSPRIHAVSALGLMQVIYGDPQRAIPPQSAPWPGGYPFLPGPKVAFGDAAHLTPDGYWWLAFWHVSGFYAGYFAAHP